jgi:hypothetical protein
LAARHFDEVIQDDFFFVTTKYNSDITAKGSRTWTQFRIDLMREAAENLLIKPAKAVNPNVKMVIKYPNWYEHFQGLGFDLEKQPQMFDGIYTGTETRDPKTTDQNLQQYESYLIFRYFENIKPGGNGGGWVDTYSIRYLDRYVEQLWNTLFAKAPEITLFEWSAMGRDIPPGDRSAWQHLPTSFNYDQMLKAYRAKNPEPSSEPTYAGVAAYALEQVDAFLGKLGKPVGIKSYKPYHSWGEDFLHNYFGNIGIPIDLRPEFPTDADMVLLTESAKFDPDIIQKIKGQLTAGKSVVMTSGLLRALQGKGIEGLVEVRYTDLLNTRFTTDYMLERLADTKDALVPEMPEHIHRWQYPESLSYWDYLVYNELEQWCMNRSAYAWNNLKDYFGLAGRSQFTVNVNNTDWGAIALNTLPTEELTLPYTGNYSNDVPVTVTGVPAPGYHFYKLVRDQPDIAPNLLLRNRKHDHHGCLRAGGRSANNSYQRCSPGSRCLRLRWRRADYGTTKRGFGNYILQS